VVVLLIGVPSGALLGWSREQLKARRLAPPG
jgi:hypothetical protein